MTPKAAEVKFVLVIASKVTPEEDDGQAAWPSSFVRMSPDNGIVPRLAAHSPPRSTCRPALLSTRTALTPSSGRRRDRPRLHIHRRSGLPVSHPVPAPAGGAVPPPPRSHRHPLVPRAPQPATARPGAGDRYPRGSLAPPARSGGPGRHRRSEEHIPGPIPGGSPFRYWVDGMEIADAGQVPASTLHYGDIYPTATSKIVLNTFSAAVDLLLGGDAETGLNALLFVGALGSAVGLWAIGWELGLRYTAPLLAVLTVANRPVLNGELPVDLANYKAEIFGRMVAFCAAPLMLHVLRKGRGRIEAPGKRCCPRRSGRQSSGVADRRAHHRGMVCPGAGIDAPPVPRALRAGCLGGRELYSPDGSLPGPTPRDGRVRGSQGTQLVLARVGAVRQEPVSLHRPVQASAAARRAVLPITRRDPQAIHVHLAQAEGRARFRGSRGGCRGHRRRRAGRRRGRRPGHA
jgi:hypothetical protein